MISDYIYQLIADFGVTRFDAGNACGAEDVDGQIRLHHKSIAARAVLMAAIEKLEAERDELGKVARMMAGILSCSNQWSDTHPEKVLEYYIQEARRD